MPKHLIKSIALCFILMMEILPVHAGITDKRAYGPLPTRTQNPLLLQILGLPIESPQTLNKKQFVSEIQTTFSNVYEVSLAGTTRLNLDMEMWRTVIAEEYGITDNLDVRLELPFITSSGGFLDGFIQDYHNLLGVPNGGRQLAANGQYQFMLAQGGTTLFNHSAASYGLSDLTLRAKWLVPQSLLKLPFKFAIAPSVKLPTGSATNGLSSGHFDFGTSLFVEKALGRFHLVSQAGLVLLGGHKEIGAILNKAFVQFGQSVEFQIMDGWSVIAQITGNTSAFKNVDAKALKGPTVDLTIGFAGSFPLRQGFLGEFYYKFGFSEDVTSTGPAVDFAVLFLTGVRY